MDLFNCHKFKNCFCINSVLGDLDIVPHLEDQWSSCSLLYSLCRWSALLTLLWLLTLSLEHFVNKTSITFHQLQRTTKCRQTPHTCAHPVSSPGTGSSNNASNRVSPTSTQFEKLIAPILARDNSGHRPAKTLYKAGSRHKSCDVCCLLTRYVDFVYGFTSTGWKYLEYIFSLRTMHNHDDNRT